MKWLSFCISNALTKTVVHFLPSARNVTAPYPVTCGLTLFADGAAPTSILVEGARLRQPDGVRLEEAFPILKEESNRLWGLMIELNSPQTRVDLSPSSCIVEFCTRGRSTRFHPVCLSDTPAEGPLIGLLDNYSASSLVFLNLSDSPLQLQPACGHESKQCFVPAVGTAEMPIDLASTPSLECSWGPMRSGTVTLGEPLPAGAACYMLHRDANTRLPLSVSTL